MKFKETTIEGAWLVDLTPITDERGFYARAWCREEFKAHGIAIELSQANLSLSQRAGNGSWDAFST